MNEKSIGVFDSGLGGLTAIKELRALLPQENIVYFGDTARVPYGNRSKDTILKFSQQIIRFLQNKEVKMIIVACGTASSVLSDELLSQYDVPVIRVINPAAQAACSINREGAIGVLGTAATVRSGVYGRAIRTIKPTARVVGKACPLFVPLVENGVIGRNNQVLRLVAEDYLKDIKNEGIDTVILGCTHYPLLEDVITDILGEDISIINCGQETARYAAAVLKSSNMLNQSGENGKTEFCVSDRPDDFSDIAARFLGSSIKGDVQVVDIEQY